MKRSFIFFALILGISFTFGSSQYFSEQDKVEYKKLLSSPKSFLGLKNSYYSIKTLKRINAEIPEKSKLCESAKFETQNKEDLYYAIAISEDLNCGHIPSEKVSQELTSSLNSNTFKDVYYGLSSLILLKSANHIKVDDKEIFSGAENLLKFGEDDGTFKPSLESDESFVFLGGLALQAFANLAEYKLPVDQKEKFQEVLDLSQDTFDAFSEETDKILFFSENSKATNLKVSSTFFKGFIALTKALKSKPETPSKEQITKIAEYFLQRKSVSSPEDAFLVLDGLTSVEENPIAIPVIISLSQGSLLPSSKSEGVLNVKVTTVLGNPVSVKLILTSAYPDSNENKPIINNQEIFGESGIYKFNFLSIKPEPGLYQLEFRVTPEKNSLVIPIESALVPLKVLTSVTIFDAQLVVSDSENSQDPIEGRKFNIESEKKIDGIINVEEFQYLSFSFKVKGQSGKSIQLQQTFLRLSNEKYEHITVAKANGKINTAQMNLQELREDFFAESGLYKLELIVGDSFVQNPFSWKFATLNIKFSNATHIEMPEQSFSAKPDIIHQFRKPESRPVASTSFAFTIFVLSPILLFLIGLYRIGVNSSNFPVGGLSSIYALGFQASFGAILLLFVLYWLKLNMMNTLKYLMILLTPTFFFGVKTLNSIHPKPKRD
jgi:oligosaccharyltransferase complex subunit delta (ribophorin II)